MGIQHPSRGRSTITIVVLVLIGAFFIEQPDLEHMLADLIDYPASLK